ncbi:MAG: hypothetical protein JWO36_7484 [Myxococcales bacterium]|nr:hypothetical protein [Myxococcales bacterium]
MRKLALLALFIPSAVLAQPYAPPPSGGPAYGGPTYAMPADPLAFHQGMTFEANLGVGYARASANGMSDSSDAALAGADFGLGGWMSPNLAITARIAGVQVKSGTGPQNGTLVNAFFGPSAQYWFDPHIWVGGGAGLSTYRQVGGNCTSADNCGVNGFGLDFRAGYSMGDTQHVFNVSVEVNPGFYSIDTGAGTSVGISVTSIALLAGYQYL